MHRCLVCGVIIIRHVWCGYRGHKRGLYVASAAFPPNHGLHFMYIRAEGMAARGGVADVPGRRGACNEQGFGRASF